MKTQSKNLLFITTSSLASNPRLVKEFETLKNDFICFVLCFRHHDWSLELSEAIKKRNPEVHFIEIDRRVEVFKTLVSKLVHKVSIVLNGLFKKNIQVCAFASNDKTPQLWFHAKSLVEQNKFHRVIAHNLGAFYPALKVTNMTETALQLDIEDFYPGEALYFNKAQEQQNRMHLMLHSFLNADVITYASKGIQLECEKYFQIAGQTETSVILNAFNSKDFKKPISRFSDKITCVWFSQHIGPNRGLETVFEIAEQLPQIEFHIIGNNNVSFLNKMRISENVLIHDVMAPFKLHAFLAKMDIGLALEPGKDLNNKIALSNKLIAYAQAGCYVIATDTYGQSQFLSSLDYPAGVVMQTSLEETLRNLEIRLLDIPSKIERWENAKSFSWDNEQLKLKGLFS
ncbi:MAG: hypothetical protein R2797_03935 [Gelidibacter sp.]